MELSCTTCVLSQLRQLIERMSNEAFANQIKHAKLTLGGTSPFVVPLSWRMLTACPALDGLAVATRHRRPMATTVRRPHPTIRPLDGHGPSLSSGAKGPLSSSTSEPFLLFRSLQTSLSGGRMLPVALSPCGNHDRSKLHASAQLLEGCNQRRGSTKAKAGPAQIGS